MKKTMYKVYVKADSNNRITAVDSSAFLSDTDGWVQIDEGSDYCNKHAQANYFTKPIRTESGLYRYKLENGRPIERSKKELATDYAELPTAPPSDAERLKAVESALTSLMLGGAVDTEFLRIQYLIGNLEQENIQSAVPLRLTEDQANAITVGEIET